jgi:hypothetical protein
VHRERGRERQRGTEQRLHRVVAVEVGVVEARHAEFAALLDPASGVSPVLQPHAAMRQQPATTGLSRVPSAHRVRGSMPGCRCGQTLNRKFITSPSRTT